MNFGREFSEQLKMKCWEMQGGGQQKRSLQKKRLAFKVEDGQKR